MKSATIIDFTAYRDLHDQQQVLQKNILPEDLGSAIQSLIKRLREANPLNDVIPA